MEQGTLQDTGERLVSETDCQNLVEHLHRYALALSLARGKIVLDIASGEGYGSSLLASVATSVIGVDIADEAILHARTKYTRSNLQYVQGSATSIPLASNSIDLAVSFETLEHHDKHREMLAELKRVLRTDGILVISTPDKRWYSDETGFHNKHHVKELYFSEFRELIEANFAQARFASQDLWVGSLITPDEPSTGPLTLCSGNLAKIDIAHTMSRPRYRICLASDAELPAIGSSFFDGQRALEDLRKYASHLKGRISALEGVMRDMESSAAYRLGHFLTRPARWLKGPRGI